MTLLTGAAAVEITPPFLVDLLGYVRRPLAARSAYEPLMATTCVFRDEDLATTVVVIAADLVGLTTPTGDRIGTAVRRRSPSAVTVFAGYRQGTLGYVATSDEYPHGGYEPSISNRGYGQPAPFSPEVAGIIERTALELLGELYA